jgi:hypothetical protein
MKAGSLDFVPMKIVYRISEQDYMDACDLFRDNEKPWYRRLSRRLMPWVGAFVLAMLALYVIIVPQRDPGFVFISCVVGFFLLYCGFALRRYFRKAYRKDHRFKNDFSAEVSEQGVHIVTSFSDSQMKWNSFVRFLESETIFMVFIAEWMFRIFPKRSFAPGQADEFRTLLQRHLLSQ